MKRTETIQMRKKSPSEDCITAFIDYSKTKGDIKGTQKWKQTTASTVLENLIEIMRDKGFDNLNEPRLENFIARIDSDPNFNRDKLFNEIAFWCNLPLPIAEATSVRNSLTFSGSDLEKATKDADPSFDDTKYKTAPPPILTNQPNDVEWINIKERERNTSGYKTVNKKRCADCWLCGDPVYVYECIPNDKSKKKLYLKCGENEHILPPGVGNMFGLLYPTLKETLEFNLTNAMVRASLRASHVWCNRLKDQMILIKPPMLPGSIYTVNEESMFILCGKDQFGELWLEKGTENRLGPDSFFHYTTEPVKIRKFLDQFEATTRAHLDKICGYLNAMTIPSTVGPVVAGNYNPYVMYRLRLVFNCCIIGYTVLFRDSTKLRKSWNKKSKGGMKPAITAGVERDESGYLTDAELKNLYNFLIDPPTDCQTVEVLLSEDSTAIAPHDPYDEKLRVFGKTSSVRGSIPLAAAAEAAAAAAAAGPPPLGAEIMGRARFGLPAEAAAAASFGGPKYFGESPAFRVPEEAAAAFREPPPMVSDSDSSEEAQDSSEDFQREQPVFMTELEARAAQGEQSRKAALYKEETVERAKRAEEEYTQAKRAEKIAENRKKRVTIQAADLQKQGKVITTEQLEQIKELEKRAEAAKRHSSQKKEILEKAEAAKKYAFQETKRMGGKKTKNKKQRKTKKNNNKNKMRTKKMKRTTKSKSKKRRN